MIKIIALLALAALPCLAAAKLFNQVQFEVSAQAMAEQSKLVAILDKKMHTSEAPEPDTYAMLLVSLALIGYTARRRM